MIYGQNNWGVSDDGTNAKPAKLCRTCNHQKEVHYHKLGVPNASPHPCRYDNLRNYTNINRAACKCVEYLPTDNLEYLEYMNEKQVQA